MPINVIIPPEPKNPSSIFKYERKDAPSADLEGLLVLCFLGILIGVYFKVKFTNSLELHRLKQIYGKQTYAYIYVCNLFYGTLRNIAFPFLYLFYQVIEVIFMIVFFIISIYLTSNSGEINIMSILPMITMVIMTSTMSWLQQKGPNKP